jgi:hypothetical protein
MYSVAIARRVFLVQAEDSLQVWRVPANIFNKELLTANKGWYNSLGVGRGVKNSRRK